MLEGFQYDVFLRHSAKAKALVHVLAARLQRDGMHVWLGAEQIKPGDSMPAKAEAGLKRARADALHLGQRSWLELGAVRGGRVPVLGTAELGAPHPPAARRYPLPKLPA